MTNRLTVDTMNDDQLDQLYAEVDRLTAELADYDQRAEQQQARAGRAEAQLTRVTALYEQWVKAGPPPLGVSTARWWDARLVELREAIHEGAEVADPAATEATERPTLRERHRAKWLALTDAERAARIAALDEDDEPERTTPDNSPTSSDEADNPVGAWAPDPPIRCLTVTADPDPFGYEERERTGRNAGLTVEAEDATPPSAT